MAAVHPGPDVTDVARTNGHWFSRTSDDVAATLHVDTVTGLSNDAASELLRQDGPNALPEEPEVPTWQRFLDQYRSYMQLILVGTAGVSLLIKQWSTAAVLVVLTLFNAV